MKKVKNRKLSNQTRKMEQGRKEAQRKSVGGQLVFVFKLRLQDISQARPKGQSCLA